MLNWTKFAAGFEIQMILRQILVCIDDREMVNAPISATVYLFYSVFLVWVFFEDRRYLFFFFSSQATLKALSDSKPRNKVIYNPAVESLSVPLRPASAFANTSPSAERP